MVAKDVIDFALEENYQSRCKYQSAEDGEPQDLAAASEALNCVNKNNGGNGVRTSKNHETQFYLYIFYTDKAHAS